VATATWRKAANQEVADRPLTPVRLTFDDGLQADPVFSPDGQSVAYAANVEGGFDIYARRVSGGNPIRITKDSADDWQPDWSPDGNRVVFRSERAGGGIFVAPITGGVEQQLAEFGFRPTWSPDGETIVFASAFLAGASPALHAVSPRGGAVRPLATTRSGAFGWLAPGEIVVLTCFADAFVLGAKSIDIRGGEIGPWQVEAAVARRFLKAKVETALLHSGDANIHYDRSSAGRRIRHRDEPGEAADVAGHGGGTGAADGLDSRRPLRDLGRPSLQAGARRHRPAARVGCTDGRALRSNDYGDGGRLLQSTVDVAG
jgi:hypothetical protein